MAVRKWGKLQRFLGGSDEDTLNRLLTTGNLVVQPAEFSGMWSSMTDPDVAAKTMGILIRKLVDIERDPAAIEKALRKAESALDAETLKMILLNTVRFIDVFYEVEPQEATFSRALEAFEAHRKSKPGARSDADEVVNHLQRRHVQNDDLAVSMVIDCSTLGFKELAAAAMPGGGGGAGAPSPAALTPPVVYRGSNPGLRRYWDEFPFVQLHLQSQLHVGANPTRIFDQVLVLLHKMPAALRSMPHFTQLRVLALLHMLHSYITVCPSVDAAWLRRAIGIVETFHHWPRPYGHVARELLAVLRCELRAPGAALRHTLLADNPQLAGSEPSAAGGLRGERVVTVMVDSTATRSALLGHLFATAVDQPVDERTPAMGSVEEETALRVQMLQQMLDVDYSFPPGSLGLEERSPEDLARWTHDALHVMWQAEHISVDGGLNKRFREERMAAILADIAPGRQFVVKRCSGGEDMGSASAASFSSSSSSSSSSASFSLAGEEVKEEAEEEEAQVPVESVPTPQGFVPCGLTLPPLNLSFHAHETGEVLERLDDGSYLAHLADVEKLQQAFVQCAESSASVHAASPAPSRPRATRMPSSLATLRREASFRKASNMQHVRRPSMRPAHAAPGSPVLRPQQLPGSPVRAPGRHVENPPAGHRLGTDAEVAPPHKPEMRVVMFGGDQTVHRVVCALMALKESSPQLYASCVPVLFVIPEGRNDLARYLVSRDMWYRRQVYAPFMDALQVLPQYPSGQALATELLDEAQMAYSLPITLQRSLVEDYVRSARHNVRICVYDVECYRELPESQDSEPAFVVPFVVRLELGLLAARARYRESKGEPQASLVDALSDREWQGATATPELTIIYSGVTMDGRFTEPVERSATAFSTVSVTNLPASCSDTELGETQSQISEHNSPSAPLLVMHTRPVPPSASAGVRATYRKRKEAEAAVEALRHADSEDVPVLVGALDMQVADPEQSFDVALDGVAYGPLKCIRVQPSALIPDGFDLRSFFPLDS